MQKSTAIVQYYSITANDLLTLRYFITVASHTHHERQLSNNVCMCLCVYHITLRSSFDTLLINVIKYAQNKTREKKQATKHTTIQIEI